MARGDSPAEYHVVRQLGSEPATKVSRHRSPRAALLAADRVGRRIGEGWQVYVVPTGSADPEALRRLEDQIELCGGRVREALAR